MSERIFSISVDTGGTFTDVVVSNAKTGKVTLGKSLTDYQRASAGLRKALEVAAQEIGISLTDLLARTRSFVYGTTRATNAIVERKFGRTALLVTKGFPDVLVLKEGGKFNAHQFDEPYPDSYIPRRDTYEINERVRSDGSISRPLDEAETTDLLKSLADKSYSAIAVAFMWSTVNPEHELAVAKMIEAILPGVPFALSHQVNPIIREYRRTSATAIDASLKPLMQAHLTSLVSDLAEMGFDGDVLISTSFGGVLHVDEVVQRPIYMVRSGPAMAPTAGTVTASAEGLSRDVIVCDTGGTTFDVTLVRDGQTKFSRETWLGPQFTGDCIGMASVDIRSIGAGGGSIAWVDAGGLMRVGPHSSGSTPGPACYGQGGTEPTVTDAALVLGYLDPDRFLGGRMALDLRAAETAVGKIAEATGKDIMSVAAAILAIANERMVKAISEITVNEGVDPKESVIVAGGGAAGLNILPIARELGCDTVILPRAAGALSAFGAQYSDIIVEYSASHFTSSKDFDFVGVASVLSGLRDRLEAFAKRISERGVGRHRISFVCEARYLHQVWEIDVPFDTDLATEDNLRAFVAAFHETHQRIFAVADHSQAVECLNWRGRLTAGLDLPSQPNVTDANSFAPTPSTVNRGYFESTGTVDLPVFLGEDLSPGAAIEGPALILEPTTTVVVYPGMSARVSGVDNYVLSTSSAAVMKQPRSAQSEEV